MTITDIKPYLAIIMMAIAVYITRISGYYLAGRIKINSVVEAWLNHLPGCILISIVAPFTLSGDWLEAVGAATTIVLMIRFQSLLIAMVVGVAIVAAGRMLLS